MRLILLILFFSFELSATKYVRATRPFAGRGSILYECVFLSQVDEHLSYFRDELKDYAVTQDQIHEELISAEDWRFEILQLRQLLDPGTNPEVIATIRDVESLLNHTDIIILYEIDQWAMPPARRPIGTLAVKRLGLGKGDLLLLESHLNIRVERPVPVKLKERPVGLPLHWRKKIYDLAQHADFYLGDVIQVNAIITDQRSGQIVLPYLNAFALQHGLYTTGRVVPMFESVVIRGIPIFGPAIFVPTFILGEGYGPARERVYRLMGGRKIPISGLEAVPDPTDPKVLVGLLSFDIVQMGGQVPYTLAKGVGVLSAQQWPRELGHLLYPSYNAYGLYEIGIRRLGQDTTLGDLIPGDRQDSEWRLDSPLISDPFVRKDSTYCWHVFRAMNWRSPEFEAAIAVTPEASLWPPKIWTPPPSRGSLILPAGL